VHITHQETTMLRNTRKGFTLIELLIVVVIIGILAAIAIPRFATTKEKAYVASMKSDLKNLSTAQEACFGDQQPNTYCSQAQIIVAPYVYQTSGGTLTVNTNTPTGWSATIVDTRVSASSTQNCGIFAGNAAAPNAAVTKEGVPACW
jgi:type IV pilus assembly protein PilA